MVITTLLWYTKKAMESRTYICTK